VTASNFIGHPPDSSVGTSGLAPTLSTLVAQRRARLQRRATASAQTEDAHTMRRDLAMNRRHMAREIEARRRNHGLRRATASPSLETREKSMKEPHGKPGTSRASTTSSPAAHGGHTGGEIDGSKCRAHAGRW
jgi:hypothetical protein